MDLLTIKESTNTPWVDLAQRAEIPLGNLHKIAHGKRGWDVKTGLKLRRIGVSLDSQIRVYAEAHGLEVPPESGSSADATSNDNGSSAGRAA